MGERASGVPCFSKCIGVFLIPDISQGSACQQHFQFGISQEYTSTRSVLILWVEAFEANACILSGKVPVHTGLFGITFVLPRFRLLS
jgi:hypothetical protein